MTAWDRLMEAQAALVARMEYFQLAVDDRPLLDRHELLGLCFIDSRLNEVFREWCEAREACVADPHAAPVR